MGNVLRLAGLASLGIGLVLAGVAAFSGNAAPVGDVACKMAVKERVLSGVYKSYGMTECPVPLWLAKSVFKNNTDARITKLRLRYKVGEYADWCPWHEYAAVDPSQTVVDLYHPILSSACAKLTAQAPADLQMEGDYVDGNGQTKQISDSRRIVFLGRHEFFFSDMTADESTSAFQDGDTYSPLLAAWVTSNDDVVARLASIGNKMSGGVGASESDEATIKVMQSLYELMLAIDITYQHPGSMQDASLSYDSKLLQSLQYPRDTIQKRSGTCIDLAILYAAMLQTVGVSPILVSLDGHCFPMGVTPSGGLVPVEATGVGGGGQSMSFSDAVKSAQKTWAKLQQNGRFTLVKCRDFWGAGIANPELEPLPPDILERWGISAGTVQNALGAMRGQQPQQGQPQGGQGQAPPPPAQPQQPQQPQPQQPAPQAPQGGEMAAGRWTGTVSASGMQIPFSCDISVRDGKLEMVQTAQYDAVLGDGYSHTVAEKNVFTGTVSGGSISATCNSGVCTVDGVAVQTGVFPLRMTATVGAGGRSVVGSVTNSMGITVTFQMTPQGGK